MIGRLSPGVSADRATATLVAIGHHLAQQYPSSYPEDSGWHFAMRPLLDERTRTNKVWLLLAFGAVLCVLLIACSNASGLLLIRTTARSSELAVRAALGAAKYRIIRQILTETALLVAAGCCGGILLAIWAVALSDRYSPVATGTRIEAWGVIFAIGMAFVSTAAAGLLPAILGAKLPVEQSLKSGATRTSTRGIGWRYLLVAGQTAVAVMLVFSAALLSRSFIKLMNVPPGFSPDHVWSGTVALPRKEHRSEDANLRFFQELQEGIAGLPGVQSVAASTAPPFNASGVLTLNRLKNDEDITSAVRNQVSRLDRKVALFDVAMMNERVAKSIRLRRFIVILLSGFAVIGSLWPPSGFTDRWPI